MAREGRSNAVGTAAYRVYWRKANDFQRLATLAMESENFNGAGLAAIHSVISACDALTAFHLGIRSKGQGHGEVADLLQGIHLGGIEEKVSQVKEVLALKNLVEYEDREISRRESQRLLRQSERVMAWVKSHLPEG